MEEKGRIKILHLIGGLFIIVLILLGIVIYQHTKIKKNAQNNIDSPEIVSKSNNAIEDNEKIQDESNSTKNNTVKEASKSIENNTKKEISKELQEQIDKDFTYSFMKLENNKKNMIYSPLSIKYALKMLEAGAIGNTYAEIEKVVGNLNVPTYNNIDKVLSLANGAFIRDTFFSKVKPKYKDILVNTYNAEIIKDQFKRAENANKWIEDRTLGIIKNILSDEIFEDEDSVMVLINALAIDMKWDREFRETDGDEFYLNDGTTLYVNMMKQETKSTGFSYYLGNDLTALTMDLKEYDGLQFEFLGIMPKDDLGEYVNTLTTGEIEKIDKNLKLASEEKNGVKVYIPRFSFDYDLNLKEDLQNLGIKDAFDKKKADFSGIAELLEKKLYVSDAMHKANIEFTEKGIKAAAVTAFMMEEEDSEEEPTYPVIVKIDRPFVFLIRDKNTKEVWFTGTVYEPELRK